MLNTNSTWKKLSNVYVDSVGIELPYVWFEEILDDLIIMNAYLPDGIIYPNEIHITTKQQFVLRYELKTSKGLTRKSLSLDKYLKSMSLNQETIDGIINLVLKLRKEE